MFISLNSHILYKFNDIATFMEFYKNNEFQEKKDYIRYLLNSYYRLFINDPKTDIDTIYKTVISDSVLKEQFGYYVDSSPISSDTGEPIEEMDIFAKEDYYKNIERSLERQRESEKIKELNNIEYQINNILNSENDNTGKIIAIFKFLNLEYDSKHPTLDNFNLDIKSHKRWEDVSDNTQNRIINIVTDYLLNETSDKTTLSDDDIKNNSMYSSWCCFALLKQIKDKEKSAVLREGGKRQEGHNEERYKLLRAPDERQVEPDGKRILDQDKPDEEDGCLPEHQSFCKSQLQSEAQEEDGKPLGPIKQLHQEKDIQKE